MRKALKTVAPAIVVAAVYLAITIGISWYYDFNASCFVWVGCTNPFADADHFAPGTVRYTTVSGYDGAEYYMVARDPFLLKKDSLVDHKTPGRFMRYQRLLYPLLVNLISLDQARFFPCTMLIINALSALGMTVILARILQSYRVSPWLSLIFTASGGLLFAYNFDLQMHLCFLLVVAGVYYYERGNMRLTWLMFSLSLLAWESAVLFVGPMALYELLRRRWRRFAVLCLTLLPFLLNQAYFAHKLGARMFSGSPAAVNWPFFGLVQRFAEFPLHEGTIRLIRSSLVIPVALFFLACLALAWAKMRRRWDNVYTLMFLVQAVYGFVAAKDAWRTFLNITRVNAGIFLPLLLSYATDREKYSRWLFAFAVLVALLALFRIFYDGFQPYELIGPSP